MTTIHREAMYLGRVPRGPLLVLVLVVSLLAGAQATIINVPAEQATIQAGINAAGTGDTVLVAPGYYLENICFDGKEIMVSSHFLLDRDPALIFGTTIDGSNPYNTDSASTVRIFCTGTIAPVFQGFSVTGGRGTLLYDPGEGRTYRHGGGIVTNGGSPIIRFNYVHHNQPVGVVDYGGGGIDLHTGNPVVDNNLVMYNPGLYGCGIFGRLAVITARNNIVAYNRGGEQFGGAGIYLYGGRLDGFNNTVAFNSSVQPGGGLRVAAATINLRNSIVWGNEGGTAPHTYLDPGYGGTITLNYTDIPGGYPGTGNISADPLLSGFWCLTGAGSPCTDAGDPDVAMNDLARPSAPTAARWPSRGGLRNDMGACGGPGCFPFEMAAISTNDILGWAPWEVSFEGESYFEAESWSWMFGDGEGGSGQAVAHTYDPGLYDVTLTVTHDGGETYEFTRENLIYAVADTMWVADLESVPSTPLQPVEVLVHTNNAVPLDDIWIPFAYSGDLELVYEGFTTVGCRAADLDTQIEQFHDPDAQIGLIELMGNPGLASGTGPILKLLFHTVAPENGQTATIYLNSDLNPYEPQFQAGGIFYQPITIDGTVQTETSCCSVRVGNANGEGEYPDEVTLADIMLLVDVKFLSGDCSKIACLPEADVNQDGGAEPSCDDHVTLSDIMYLVDFLFITGPELGTLPECL
jgi:hypothetical protein